MANSSLPESRELEWASLMRDGIAGDALAYRHVLELLAADLKRLVRRQLSSCGYAGAEVEDIVQETLLSIHMKRGTWRSNEPISPWVKAIARNKTIDHLRRMGKKVCVPIDDVVHSLRAEETARYLSECEAKMILSSLKARQRDVVQAISIRGWSVRETAAKLLISESTVRVALHRGLKALGKNVVLPNAA